MDINTYQKEALATAIYPGQHTFAGLIYTALKLNGEAGEVAEKIGKIIRDNNSVIDSERKHLLVLELGDVLWYIAALAKELNYTLEDVAIINLNKLASRRERKVLQGSGDER